MSADFIEYLTRFSCVFTFAVTAICAHGAYCSSDAGSKVSQAPVADDPRRDMKNYNARDVVNEWLAAAGMEKGYDEKNERMICVGSHRVTPCDESKINQAFRQIAYRKALANALGQAAEHFGDSRVSATKSPDLDITESGTMVHLSGWSVLVSVESGGRGRGFYEMSVAIVWSKKLESCAKAIMAGLVDHPTNRVSGCSIEEIVDNNVDILGIRYVSDNVGDLWVIGAVAIDDAMRRYVASWFDDDVKASLGCKLRAYVLDEIAKSICSEIKVHSELRKLATNMVPNRNVEIGSGIGSRKMKIDESGAYNCRICNDSIKEDWLDSTLLRGDEYSYVSTVSDVSSNSSCAGISEFFKSCHTVRPVFRIDPRNPKVRWFVRQSVDNLTGKPIEVWIGAIRCRDITIGEKELHGQRAAQ